MLRSTRIPIIIAIVIVSLGIIIASLMIGTETLSMSRAWSEYQSGRPLSETPTLSVLIHQRLPRTLAALLVGSGLALVGCSFQALLRNPLATPYTLGIASSGAFGAWTATILIEAYGISASYFGIPTIQSLAFIFALLDVLIVYFIAVRRGRTSPAVLLLAGVTMGMLANSGILLMRYLADPERVVMMDRWLMGGVDILGFEPVYVLLIGVVPCMIILMAQAGKFDQLGFGAEMATGRGVNVPGLITTTFLLGSLMSAIIVSKVGPIGFVGLIVPHAVRSITGSRHRLLMPVSVLAGGAFLCCCDIVARKILPGETPIGIITTLLGGPFFLYLLMRRRFTDWEV